VKFIYIKLKGLLPEMDRSIRQNSSKLQEHGMAFEDVKMVQTTGGHNRGGTRSAAKRAELERPSKEIR